MYNTLISKAAFILREMNNMVYDVAAFFSFYPLMMSLPLIVGYLFNHIKNAWGGRI